MYLQNVYRDLVGKPEGERPVGRPRGKFEDSVKVVLKEMGWYGVGWINLAQDDTCVSCEHRNETSGSIKCGEIGLAEELTAYEEGFYSVQLFSYLKVRDPLTRLRRRLKADIKMTCKIRHAYEDMGCICVVRDRFQGEPL